MKTPQEVSKRNFVALANYQCPIVTIVMCHLFVLVFVGDFLIDSDELPKPPHVMTQLQARCPKNLTPAPAVRRARQLPLSPFKRGIFSPPLGSSNSCCDQMQFSTLDALEACWLHQHWEHKRWLVSLDNASEDLQPPVSESS